MSNENINLLDTDLSTVDTSFPLLAPGTNDFRIDDAEIIENTESGTKSLSLTLKTTGPCLSDKGENMESATVFHRVLLTPVGKATLQMVQRGVAEVVQAAGLTGVTLPTIDTWHKQLVGRLVRAATINRASVNKKTGQQYPVRSEVKAFYKN